MGYPNQFSNRLNGVAVQSHVTREPGDGRLHNFADDVKSVQHNDCQNSLLYEQYGDYNFQGM